MTFPESVSFTLTNACNLRCKMCGQWGEEGYMNSKMVPVKNLELEKWKSLVDELVENNVTSVLLRGGEPFLFRGIMELVNYINSKKIFISIDTNGTLLHKYADELVQLGNIHLTISIDGPDEIHDEIREVKDCFSTIKKNIQLLREAEIRHNKKISTSLTFTITEDNYQYLGQMPNIARSLAIPTITIVPCYWILKQAGELYQQEMKEFFNCYPFSWKGFHHDDHQVDGEVLVKELRKYHENLKEIKNFPYMELTTEQYRQWFADYHTQIGPPHCPNVNRLLDIQPNGNANFCVDFPDYSIGNVREYTIKELWNSERAIKFRAYRNSKPLSVCMRCGAKHMGEIPDKV